MIIRTGQLPLAGMASTLNQMLQSLWWPVLLAITLYHLFISSLYRRATISLLRRREFGAK
jgi:hypothetical protein